MKRIKIKPKPTGIPPNDSVTTTTTSTSTSTRMTTSASAITSETSNHDDSSEIKELKDDIFNLKKELIELKTQFDIFKQQQQQQQQQQQLWSQSQNQSHQHQSQHFCSCDFIEWVNTLEITPADLERLFKSKDICEWACSLIVDDLNKKTFEHVPICSIKGSKNDILIYTSNRWMKPTDEELSLQFVNKLFKKLLRSFTDWKNENYKLIMVNDKIGTIYHTNNARILSFNENTVKLKHKLFHALNIN
jgi:hypothetical protein